MKTLIKSTNSFLLEWRWRHFTHVTDIGGDKVIAQYYENGNAEECKNVIDQWDNILVIIGCRERINPDGNMRKYRG